VALQAASPQPLLLCAERYALLQSQTRIVALQRKEGNKKEATWLL
jgi:hypothetical protein